MPDCLRFEFLHRTDIRPCGRCAPCLTDEPVAPAETEDEEKARLTASLETRGIKVDGRWRIQRLRTLDAATPG